MSNTLDTLINKALETEKAKFSKIEEVSKEDENEIVEKENDVQLKKAIEVLK